MSQFIIGKVKSQKHKSISAVDSKKNLLNNEQNLNLSSGSESSNI